MWSLTGLSWHHWGHRVTTNPRPIGSHRSHQVVSICQSGPKLREVAVCTTPWPVSAHPAAAYVATFRYPRSPHSNALPSNLPQLALVASIQENANVCKKVQYSARLPARNGRIIHLPEHFRRQGACCTSLSVS